MQFIIFLHHFDQKCLGLIARIGMLFKFIIFTINFYNYIYNDDARYRPSKFNTRHFPCNFLYHLNKFLKLFINTKKYIDSAIRISKYTTKNNGKASLMKPQLKSSADQARCFSNPLEKEISFRNNWQAQYTL